MLSRMSLPRCCMAWVILAIIPLALPGAADASEPLPRAIAHDLHPD